jgi:predicted DNA-binding transcriptional regulator AlpA
MVERIVRTPEAAKRLGLSVSTLNKFRVTGEGPVFVRLGPGKCGSVGYTVEDLDAWVAARRVRSTSEVPGVLEKVKGRVSQDG